MLLNFANITERSDPLLIGALKSNIGHSEAASGLCSLTKVILSFLNKCIPANLHYNTPNQKISALIDGTLKPIVVNTPFNANYIAINNFGFGGSNCCLLLKANDNQNTKSNSDIFGEIPRLILMCGRSEESVRYAFEYITNNINNEITCDYLSLINEISKTSPFDMNSGLKGMNYRGFALIDNLTQNAESKIDVNVSKIEEKRPVWFLFCGAGHYWPIVASSLMNIDIFANTINKFAQMIKQKYTFDLLDVIYNRNITSTMPGFMYFTAIAIQLAFVDLFKALDITPDGIIGISMGEIACAYADGCYTFDEIPQLIDVYFKTLLNNTLSQMTDNNGMYVETDLTWEEAEQRCPPGM